MEKSKNILTKCVVILSAIINVVFLYFLFKYKILPLGYRNGLLVFLGLIFALFIYLGFVKKKNTKALKVASIIFLLILSLGQVAFMSYARKSIKTLEEINNKTTREKSEISFVVLKDSKIKNLKDIAGKEIGIAQSFDKENTDKAFASYKKDYGTELKSKDLTNYQAVATSLLDGNIEVMMLNESFRPLLDESIEGFSQKTRVLDSILVEGEKKENAEKEQVKENQSFNIYLSGIDTYGSLSTVSRSDVNLIVSVNPIKKKILITTIPRDTYLSIGGEGDKLDKLTHAGLFGVDTSMKSLESFLDVNLDYYGKVNFTSLTDLINTLGGISVDNPVDFESSDGSYYFPQGRIDMDGDMALSFSRERYHLQEGDFDRGKNHTRVLTGIIRKMLSPEMLINFNQIANIALESVNTDIGYNKMIELANKQLEDGGEWKIESQALKGKGAMGLDSYLMPNANLYMMVANKESIKEVHDKIIENNK
ncbi:LCP family protein [uncultured Anaerococcus sp.]|uniref:LCP family glycopolymer transferase n=1 Tax=uncultured Anaerococcus sp. TaxID=293428 RepID=UPI002889E230|nr:LCP family protein [uncultured Anaerococcus sp.]